MSIIGLRNFSTTAVITTSFNNNWGSCTIGNELFISSYDGTKIAVFDVVSKSLKRSLVPPTFSYTIGTDGTNLLIKKSDNKLYKIDITNGSDLGLYSTLVFSTMSSSGNFYIDLPRDAIYICTYTNTFEIRKFSDGTLIKSTFYGSGSTSGITLVNNDFLVVTEYGANLILIYDISNGPGNISLVQAFSAATNVVSSAYINNKLYITTYGGSVLNAEIYTFLGTRRTTLNEMKIGDYIPCRYTAPTIGSMGSFSELGTCIASGIPLTASSTSDGLFNWILSGYDSKGRMKLIADRNIQYSISWDNLNSNGAIYGLPIIFLTPDINTWNPYDKGSAEILSNNNMTISVSATGTGARSTKSYSNGKYYVEYAIDSGGAMSTVGITNATSSLGWQMVVGYLADGTLSVDGVRTGAVNPTYTTGDLIGMCIDLDNKTVQFYKNGVIAGALITFTSNGPYYMSVGRGSSAFKASINCGYKNFVYTAPDGYTAPNSILESNYDTTIRLLTGGVSSVDADDEWDKIIVTSDLGGTITSGDNNVWHWSGIASWNSTASVSGNNYRVFRGGSTIVYPNYGGSPYASSTVGFRPVLIAEILNLAPIITLSSDRDIFYKNPILLTGDIIDPDSDPIHYRILLNDLVYKDWLDSLTEVTINESITLNLDTTITIEANDGISTRTASKLIKQKINNSTYVDSTNPDVNFLEYATKLSASKIVLLNISYGDWMGYLLGAILNLNIASGTLGTIQMGFITSSWNDNTVTYTNKPTFSEPFVSYTINSTGQKQIDITSFLRANTTKIYGIYITTTDADLTLDLSGNEVDISYVQTLLNQPSLIYSNRCKLDWKSFIYGDSTQVEKFALYRDINPDFSTEVGLFESSDLTLLSYMDTFTPSNQYYYRLKLYTVGEASPRITPVINVPAPDSGYRNKLTDEINIKYTTILAEGLSFDDTEVDYNFYTTPDRIHLRALDLGTMIGGRTQGIFKVEVINSYDTKNFEITLRGTTPDGIVAEPYSTYGLLHDSDNILGRTKVELAIDSNSISVTPYPLKFTLNAGQRQIVFIRVTPTIYNTVGTKQIQLKLTGRPI